MMHKFYYKDIIKKGKNNNKYYDQTDTQRSDMVRHLLNTISIFSERTGGFASALDWKQYNNELGESVKWAKGNWQHKPSVKCIWAELIKNAVKQYKGKPARFSLKHLANFNKSIKVAVQVYNLYTLNVPKETAADHTIKMEKSQSLSTSINNNFGSLFSQGYPPNNNV